MNRAVDSALDCGTRASINWKLLLGLSRTPHGVLDMATPAMAALLWLGHFPAASTVIVGLITAFAGYTAVYALNDIVDCRVDVERLSIGEGSGALFDVDAIMAPHPIARGLLPFKIGFIWMLFWAVVALTGAWWLNPVCALIFMISASLETLYCKLLRITHLKIIPSAIVKATGGLAGVYAVDPNPSPAFVALIFLWLAAWEVGGQNIANDFVDMNDDAKVSAKTTITVVGIHESVFIMIVAVSLAVCAAVAAYWLARGDLGVIYVPGAALLGWILLLEPVRGVYRDPGPKTAAALFNKASYMPAAFLILSIISIAFSRRFWG
jgi:4-hydroxybenzoate polyprenyltransferase